MTVLVIVSGATCALCGNLLYVIGHVRPVMVASDRIVHSASDQRFGDGRVMMEMQDKLE